MKNSIIGKLQLLISFVAVVAIAALAFMPLISISVESNEKIYETSFDTLINAAQKKEADMIEEEGAELYGTMSEEEFDAYFEQKVEAFHNRYNSLKASLSGVNENGEAVGDAKIEVSAIDIYKSATDTITLVQYWAKCVAIDTLTEDMLAEDISPETLADLQKEKADLTEELLADMDPSIVNEQTIGTFRLFFNSFISVVDLSNIGEDTIVKVIAVALLTVLKVLILISLLVLFPVAMVFSVLGLLLGLLSKKRYNKVLKKCKKAVTWMGTVLVALVVLGAELTTNGTMLLAVAGAAVAVNLVASIFKSYTAKERRFLTVMQFTSVISVIGLLIFAFNFAKADLVSFYTSTALTDQVTAAVNAAMSADIAETGAEVAKDLAIALAIFAGMGVLAVCMLMSVFKKAIKLITRIACMGKGGKAGLFFLLICAGVVVLNNYVMDKYDVALSTEQADALNVALVGLAVTFVGNLLFSILKGVFARGITKEEVKAVMSGSSVNDIPKE